MHPCSDASRLPWPASLTHGADRLLRSLHPRLSLGSPVHGTSTSPLHEAATSTGPGRTPLHPSTTHWHTLHQALTHMWMPTQVHLHTRTYVLPLHMQPLAPPHTRACPPTHTPHLYVCVPFHGLYSLCPPRFVGTYTPLQLHAGLHPPGPDPCWAGGDEPPYIPWCLGMKRGSWFAWNIPQCRLCHATPRAPSLPRHLSVPGSRLAPVPEPALGTATLPEERPCPLLPVCRRDGTPHAAPGHMASSCRPCLGCRNRHPKFLPTPSPANANSSLCLHCHLGS